MSNEVYVKASTGRFFIGLLYSYPFYTLGFTLGYDFSILIIYMGFLIPVILLEKKKFDSITLLLIVFSLTILVSYLSTNEASTSSLLAVYFFVFFLFNSKQYIIEENKIFKLLRLGLLMNLIYSVIQIFGEILDVNVFLPDILIIERYRLSKPWEIFRPIGFFLEPAHLSIYSILILLLAKNYLSDSSKYLQVKLLVITQVLFSLSLSGIIILVTFLGIEYFGKNVKILTFIKRLGFIVFGIGVMFMIFESYAQIIFQRILTLYEVLQEGSFSGSEGVRGNAVLVGYDFIDSSELMKIMFGVGPGNVDNWIAQRFMFSESNTLQSGKLPNSLVAILISYGLFGLLSYLILTSLIIIKYTKSNAQVLVFVLINFAWGFFIGYLLWVYLIIIRKIRSKFQV